MNLSTSMRALIALAVGLLGSLIVAIFGALYKFEFTPPFTLGKVKIPTDAFEPKHNAAPFVPELLMHSENMFVSLDNLLDDQNTALIQLLTKQVGFPFRCLEGRLWVVSFDSSSQYELFTDGSIVLSKSDIRYVPIRLKPVGFLLNVFVYGAIVFVAWMGLMKWRRATRIRNRKCVSCGHIVLRGSARCQECGTHRNAPRRRSG